MDKLVLGNKEKIQHAVEATGVVFSIGDLILIRILS